jgi:hypothetical protein
MPDDAATVLDIVLACRRIIRFIADADKPTFLADEEKHWAVVSQLNLIGEAANDSLTVSATPILRFPGARFPACETAWYTTTTRSIGRLCGRPRAATFHN